MLQGRAGFGENGCDVRHHLAGLLLHTLGHFPGGWIHADGAGNEHELSGNGRMAIRAKGFGGIGADNGLFHGCTPFCLWFVCECGKGFPDVAVPHNKGVLACIAIIPLAAPRSFKT
ncbi:hypothetical protein SDC9_176524 [bioreactor metagenome]|uniref:Uncharacterized protein n=1 Tax=bioreactor metagenome TaxID=1076179 RepID=A0A645GQW7_9ZZZZ